MTMYDAIRKLFPHSRRGQPVGIIVSTSRRRVVQCIRCGATESCCNDYPETKTVRDFRAKHDAACGAALIAQAGAHE